MPPLPAAPQTLRIDQFFSIGADLTALSRFFVAYTGVAPSDAELLTFATAVNGYAAADFASVVAGDNYIGATSAVDLSSATAAQAEFSALTVGTRAGSDLPADASAVSSYEIGRRYRGGHPRGYWPFGTSVDTLTEQEWRTTSVTAFYNAVTDYMASVVAAGWALAGTLTHVNVSYFAGFTVQISPGTGRARNVPTKRAAPVINPVLAVVLRQRIGSQRRRLGRS